jgi:hypothetical protein
MRLTNAQPDPRPFDPAARPLRGAGARMQFTSALAATLALVAAHLTANACQAAGLVISAPDFMAATGSSGSFLVEITDTDPSGSTPFIVAGDSFELTLTGAGVTFTDAVIPSTGPPPVYIYNDSSDVDQGLPLWTAPINPFPTTDFTAADSANPLGSSPYTTLKPGDVYTLGLVSYSVSPGATPGSVVTIGFGSGTSLSDNNLNAVAFTTTNGLITITSASVPEPSSWVPALLATVIIPLFLGSRHWVARTSCLN